jgi:hypothetical protein
MDHRPVSLTRRQVIALAAAAAALAGCASAPPVAPVEPAAMTPAERAVRATLDRYWAASKAGQLEAMLAHFSEDAKVDSMVAGAKVAKADWAVAMRAWLANPESRDFQSVSRVDRATSPRPSRAVVDTQTTVRRHASLSRPGWSRDRRVEYALEERAGQWLIVETTYTDK